MTKLPKPHCIVNYKVSSWIKWVGTGQGARRTGHGPRGKGHGARGTRHSERGTGHVALMNEWKKNEERRCRRRRLRQILVDCVDRFGEIGMGVER